MSTDNKSAINAEFMELHQGQLPAMLQLCVDTDTPLFIWGPPGIGKSQITTAFTKSKGMDLVTMQLGLMEPVDLRGLPVVNDARDAVNWVPLGELPTDPNSSGILFLDELPNADPSVQAAAMQLVLDRRLGAYHLPKGWRVVAAGNRMGDAAAARRMPTALADRFTHITLVPNVDAWAEASLDAGISPIITAFVLFRKDMLHNFDPTRTVNTTPRGWWDADKALKMDQRMDKMETVAFISGRVGNGAMTELRSFVRVWHDLPDVKKILAGDITSSDLDEPAQKYAISLALAGDVNEYSFGNMTQYLGTVGSEFSKMAVLSALKRDPKLVNTKAYMKWVTTHMSKLSGR